MTSGRDDVPESSSFHTYAKSKAAADAHLRETSLNWTILGPGTLTLEPASGRIDAGEHIREGATSRSNVAEVARQCVLRTDLGGVTLPFRDGETSIEAVLDELAR